MSQELQATVVFDTQANARGPMSMDISRAQVGVVAGAGPRFEDQSAGLLRTRLLAASLIMTVVLSVTFVGNLFANVVSLWWLRLLVVGLLAGIATLLLRAGSKCGMRQLRILELVVFGAVAFQLSMMFHTRLSLFAARKDAVSVCVVVQQFNTAFCVLIFTYGTLIPNSWKRGVVVMLGLALLPQVTLFVSSWKSESLTSMLALNNAHAPLPMTFIATLVSTLAAHVIQAIRRDAFKAKQLGQYRLMDKLGAGGMGEVYKAEHMLLRRPCAIKLIKPANDRDAATIARFEK